ncbi:hypothetical protein KKH3_31970 [Pectobacterium actinidiae]|nr:hypothetical protein KKH3_31970 [Pectobacterium actinidiae]
MCQVSFRRKDDVDFTTDGYLKERTGLYNRAEFTEKSLLSGDNG